MYNYKQIDNSRRTMDEHHFVDEEQSLKSQTLMGCRAEYEPVHKRTFNVDRNTRLKFEMDRGSEKTRITRPMASGDEISCMRHQFN